MRKMTLIAATIATTGLLAACSSNEQPAPNFETYSPAPPTKQEDMITDGEVGKPFYTNDRYGDGPVEVRVSALEVHNECIDGSETTTADAGDTLVTIGADLGALQAPGAVDTPKITFFDADGYELSAVLTYCDQPKDTKNWMAITITPGDRVRASSTYEVNDSVAEVRVGNHSFIGDQIARAE